jgi:hypothetical protein
VPTITVAAARPRAIAEWSRSPHSAILFRSRFFREEFTAILTELLRDRPDRFVFN